MSQHPFNIADQSFPAMLTTLNQVAQALASSSSGGSEPGTTYPYQIWADTTNNLLKLRNGANNAWMTLAAFDTTNNRWQPRFDVMQVLSSAGLTVKKSDGSAAILTLADNGTLDVPAIKQNGTALGAAALKGFTDNNDLSVAPGNVGTRGNMKAAIDAIPSPDVLGTIASSDDTPVGSYIFAKPAGTYGALKSAADLYYSDSNGNVGSGAPPAGTWKCLGHSTTGGATLYKRVS